MFTSSGTSNLSISCRTLSGIPSYLTDFVKKQACFVPTIKQKLYKIHNQKVWLLSSLSAMNSTVAETP